MTEKELRKLGKTDLLTILRDQQAEIESLQNERDGLLEKMRAKTIDLEKSGSIAEAALALNGVFQAAQQAADQYLGSIRLREADIERRLKEQEDQAAQEIQARFAQTEIQCRSIEKEAQAKADAFWTELEQRLERYYSSHEGLRAMLTAAGIDISIPNSPRHECP